VIKKKRYVKTERQIVINMNKHRNQNMINKGSHQKLGMNPGAPEG